MNPADNPIVLDTRLERLRNTPVWAPTLPSRSTKPASAPVAVAGRVRSTGGAISNADALNPFNALSTEGRPSTFGSATTSFMYMHRREDKAVGFHQPDRQAVGGRHKIGANALEGAATAGFSFKLWSDGRGTNDVAVTGGGDAAQTMTANNGNFDEDDQSSLGTLVGKACNVTTCHRDHFASSSSLALSSFEKKGGVGVTVKTAVAAPTSDFGITAAVRHLGGGSVGPGGVGSEASFVASAVAPALVEPDRPVGRLLCTLVQLSTRCACVDKQDVLVLRSKVDHGLSSYCMLSWNAWTGLVYALYVRLESFCFAFRRSLTSCRHEGFTAPNFSKVIENY